jgi:predicted ATPase
MDRDRIEAVEESLRKVVPRARRIRTPPAGVNRNETQIISLNGQEHAVNSPRTLMGHRLEIEMEGAGFLDASLVSEGTLIALGILALVHSESCPKVVLIDDLDHSLHPSAYEALVRCLREIQNSRPELQLVCTTHSPYLLDYFEAEEIRVLSLDAAGHTQACKLEAHPEWSKAHGALSTGEFWSTVGEHWVANGSGSG